MAYNSLSLLGRLGKLERVEGRGSLSSSYLIFLQLYTCAWAFDLQDLLTTVANVQPFME